MTGKEVRPAKSRRLEIWGISKTLMRSLTGTVDQVPPPFSAKKIGGVPSYKMARKNQAVEIAPSRVHIEQFEMVKLDSPFMTFRVVCSPGTYIRSLAHDLGKRLGYGAHLTALRRIQSGEFRIENAVSLKACDSSDITPVESLLGSLPMIEVSGSGRNQGAPRQRVCGRGHCAIRPHL